MKKKYLILPDYVYSRYDNQKHFITAKELMRLYEVDPKECVIYDPSKNQPTSTLIVLGPKSDGRYKEYIDSLKG